MLRGYRLLFAAACAIVVCACLGVGAYFGALNAPHFGYQSEHPAYRATHLKNSNPSQADRDRAGLPYFAERIASGPDPKSDDEREKRDLAAQESTSVWAFWMLLVSSLSVVVTMIGTGFLLWQIVLTRKAVEDSDLATKAMVRQNEIAELANRAWLDVDVKIHSVDLRSNACIDFSIIIKNVGAGVAFDVIPRYQWFFDTSFVGEGCQDFFEECSNKAEYGLNCVTPGSEQEVRMEHKRSIRAVDGDSYVTHSIWIAVCATYSTSKGSLRWEQVNRAVSLAVKTDNGLIESLNFHDTDFYPPITLPVTPLTQVWHFDKPESQKPSEYA